MKKLILVLLLIIGFIVANAQSGFYENRYYAQQYSIQDVCGQPYSVFQGYDSWGTPVYYWYRNCQRAIWQNYYGQYTGYFWSWNGNQYVWQARTEWRTWWYYTWQNYTIRIQ